MLFTEGMRRRFDTGSVRPKNKARAALFAARAGDHQSKAEAGD